ncbi:MAG: 50S ribosomal protein L10, partial [Heliobacteriaceae bacterium]|nr:50S ribosomal protein L10 [Heliobacteriaceae bacterium]
MPNITEKSQVVARIRERLEKAQACVLVDFRGLTVKEATELRAKMRNAGVEFKVLKNTMVQIAANDIGIKGLEPYLEGPTAIVFGYDDPVMPAKLITEFIKGTKNKNFAIKAGILEGKVVDVISIKALADLPSREVLLAQVLAGIQ